MDQKNWTFKMPNEGIGALQLFRKPFDPLLLIRSTLTTHKAKTKRSVLSICI
jgi:hypothetical protein